MASVENVTPDRNFNLPLESQLTGAAARMMNQAAPFTPFGAGYNLLPDQAMGQIYMPGPNATLFGNNPFGLTPYGQGYFGGAYNSIGPQTAPGHTGFAGGNPFLGQSWGMGMPRGQGYGGTSYNYVAPQTDPGYRGNYAPPSFGQGGFPYYDFAQWQQGFYGGGGGTGDPYAHAGAYYNNPWPGYGGMGGAGIPTGFPPAYSSGGASGFQPSPVGGAGGQSGAGMGTGMAAPGAGSGAGGLGGASNRQVPMYGMGQAATGTPIWHITRDAWNSIPGVLPAGMRSPGGGKPNPNSTQGYLPPNHTYAYKYAPNYEAQQQQQQQQSQASSGSRSAG